LDQILETDRHRYVFVSHLAEGGMGAIYLGRRVSAGQRSDDRSTEVVLKQLLPEHSADQKLIDMFLREWRVTSQLDHHNIVRTLDVLTAGDDYYIVFEYVRGGDLRTILRRAKRRQTRLSVASALFIASEVLAALAYAHAKRDTDGRALGIIHRDVSPSNILLGAEGTVKLTDFGIAKAPTQGSVMFKVKGKLGYMAPEQARGEAVDARADLFAVGVVLYEALVGERLFVGQMTQAASVFSQPVRPPSKKRPEISAAIDEIVMRALSLDPVGRFASAQEFRAALIRAAEIDRLPLGESVLAADLRRACGDDSNGWRNLDVPVSATLDAGGEGTGVILTGNDDGDFDDDRQYTGSRPAILPDKELKSLVHFIDERAGEVDRPSTQLAETSPGRPLPPDRSLAFANTMAIPDGGTSSGKTDFEDEDSAVLTQVQTLDPALRRGSAAQSRPPASQSRPPASQSRPPASQSRPPASQSRPPASQSRPPAAQSRPPAAQSRPPEPSASISVADRRRAEAARAQFEPPVPRPSVPPPSLSDLDLPQLPSAPAPARSSTGGSNPSTSAAARSTPKSASRDVPTKSFDVPGEPTARSRAKFRGTRPASLSALERNLGERPITKAILATLLILILVALGIGLGVLLSGPNLDALPDGMSEVRAPR
jgi:serine/threonine-protein kinase